jgi:uncharacterized alkaline shock family protein YloU
VNTPGEVRMHVADAVVARVAALRARQVPGVVALRADPARAVPDTAGTADAAHGRDSSWIPADGVSAAVHGGSAEVEVTVVTRLGRNCRDLAQAVQQEVAAGVRAYTGLDALVTVTVADVLLD